MTSDMREEDEVSELTPQEAGGRAARRGFSYQDHITAAFCLETLLEGAPEEIWIEHRDDITLVWRSAETTLIEFVQVKAEDRKSRWSIAALTMREQNVIGTSLLERSLAQARGINQASFRIITSADTDHHLSVLKNPPEHAARRSPEAERLVEAIAARVPGAVAPSGTTVTEWVRRCRWEKRTDSLEALRALNLGALERLLAARKKELPYEHRDAMYDDLLQLISDAATADLSASA